MWISRKSFLEDRASSKRCCESHSTTTRQIWVDFLKSLTEVHGYLNLNQFLALSGIMELLLQPDQTLHSLFHILEDLSLHVSCEPLPFHQILL